ncbi:uncharacterized protein MONBRDRAFT_11336 [Monosiga brevicollis MX1]|uniref:tRNA-5-taurinomethyluridine 2-sulfurtransferase n=1 Tax=Monosiga brevicollis TaxID=81824 RepID=A9V8Y1_MONBE|nr:uncharacterized protein MONBRDRAFT_11336 [Monosiga brevicollis MX1]EDQ86037.1 predicted protein [Monosiga brevicollis MX1]|eukprot:XP_001749231.1 hypothetical protein [Monosiga brevicollis MX1]
MADHLSDIAGHEVTGVFMRTWDELDETGVCTAEGDWRHVQDIAQRLGIPCKRVDFVQEYWHSVFQVMLDELAAGATPNPDILCNRHIKFDAFYHFARDQLGADRVAMGHYARVDEREPDMPRLLRGCDDNKDQSYFLAGLPVHVLRHAAFPLGHLTKDRVKALAAAAGFSDVAGQRESMGLCFVGKRRFGALVQQYLPPRPGVFVHLESGRQLGPVTDLNVITFGQSARLDGQPVRCYVAGKDMTAGAAYVVEGLHHPCLHARAFALSNVHWTHPPPQDVEANLHVRIRHRGQLHPCAVGPLPGPFDSIKGTPAQAEEQFFTDLSLWQVSVVRYVCNRLFQWRRQRRRSLAALAAAITGLWSIFATVMLLLTAFSYFMTWLEQSRDETAQRARHPRDTEDEESLIANEDVSARETVSDQPAAPTYEWDRFMGQVAQSAGETVATAAVASLSQQMSNSAASPAGKGPQPAPGGSASSPATASAAAANKPGLSLGLC